MGYKKTTGCEPQEAPQEEWRILGGMQPVRRVPVSSDEQPILI